jgi:hypothetical protein
VDMCDGIRFYIILVLCLGKLVRSQIGWGLGNFLCGYHIIYASGVLHARRTLDVFYHCASLQLKNLRVLNNSDPAIVSINI